MMNKKIYLIGLFVWGVFSLSFGQCPKVMIHDKMNRNHFEDSDSYLEQDTTVDKVLIFGNYLYEVDSVKIWKCESEIYKDEINNYLALTDGVSFGTELVFEKNEQKMIILQFDDCFFPLSIPNRAKRIFTTLGTRPILQIELF